MPGRPVNQTQLADLRALHRAARMAHQLDDEPGLIASVFAEFGRVRWLVVPLAGVAIAVFVLFVGFLAGAAGKP